MVAINPVQIPENRANSTMPIPVAIPCKRSTLHTSPPHTVNRANRANSHQAHTLQTAPPSTQPLLTPILVTLPTTHPHTSIPVCCSLYEHRAQSRLELTRVSVSHVLRCQVRRGSRRCRARSSGFCCRRPTGRRPRGVLLLLRWGLRSQRPCSRPRRRG